MFPNNLTGFFFKDHLDNGNPTLEAYTGLACIEGKWKTLFLSLYSEVRL